MDSTIQPATANIARIVSSTSTPTAEKDAGVSQSTTDSHGFDAENAVETASPVGADLAQTRTSDSGPDRYARFTSRRKVCISVILAMCGLLAPLATTGCLTAVPQIAETYGTTGSIVNVSNGLYTGAMGLSAYIWGAMGVLAGRRSVFVPCTVTFFAFSVGNALAPNLGAFYAFRTLSGFAGTGLLISGPAIIGDLYRPTERATALGWIMSGTLIGPAFGPCIGGIIVTYSSWRNIYWFQAGFAGLAMVLALAFIPETSHTRKWDSIPRDQRITQTLRALNPVRVFVLFSRRNLLLVALASSSLLWNMYAFLAPIVYVINPRVGFTTPLQSGLFYLAPGCGYLLATFFGGRWADWMVKRWIRKRDGRRRPEDRLRAAVPWMGLGTPACMLVYGWCLQFEKGGIALLVVVMFIQGFTQLMIFPALNTYCLDVMPSRSTEVLGGNFLIRYTFGALGTALALPAIDHIGIGWFCTLTSGVIILTCAGLLLVIHHEQSGGDHMRASREKR